jgi:hypothetical protein
MFGPNSEYFYQSLLIILTDPGRIPEVVFESQRHSRKFHRQILKRLRVLMTTVFEKS